MKTRMSPKKEEASGEFSKEEQAFFDERQKVLEEAVKETVRDMEAVDAALRTLEKQRISTMWAIGKRIAAIAGDDSSERLRNGIIRKFSEGLSKANYGQASSSSFCSVCHAFQKLFTEKQFEELRDREVPISFIHVLVAIKDKKLRDKYYQEILDGKHANAKDLRDLIAMRKPAKSGEEAEKKEKKVLPPKQVFKKAMDQLNTFEDAIITASAVVAKLADIKDEELVKETVAALRELKARVPDLVKSMSIFVKIVDKV